MVRPSGFEPPTFCSGGIAIKANPLILRFGTQHFRGSRDGSSEKLQGKLLGKFSARNSLSPRRMDGPDYNMMTFLQVVRWSSWRFNLRTITRPCKDHRLIETALSQ